MVKIILYLKLLNIVQLKILIIEEQYWIDFYNTMDRDFGLQSQNWWTKWQFSKCLMRQKKK